MNYVNILISYVSFYWDYVSLLEGEFIDYCVDWKDNYLADVLKKGFWGYTWFILRFFYRFQSVKS